MDAPIKKFRQSMFKKVHMEERGRRKEAVKAHKAGGPPIGCMALFTSACQVCVAGLHAIDSQCLLLCQGFLSSVACCLQGKHLEHAQQVLYYRTYKTGSDILCHAEATWRTHGTCAALKAMVTGSLHSFISY